MAGDGRGAGAAASPSLHDAAILVAAGSAGAFLAQWARLPAGLILGAMVASALMKISGLVQGPLTDALLLPAYVVLGAMIGARFRGFEPARIARLLGAGVTGFVIAMILAFAGAVAAHRLSNLPLALTLVAFAPGGLEAMSIMAFALNLDPAYVGAMQIARYVGISLLLPIMSRALERMWRSSGGWNS
jgi:membrane AbrB-like protein